jgi:hypothetical protein
MVGKIAARWKIGVALRTLRKLRIPFSGPLTTIAKKKRIYLVCGFILTEPEVMALPRNLELNAEGIPRLLLELKRLHGREELGGSDNE